MYVLGQIMKERFIAEITEQRMNNSKAYSVLNPLE
jgi:hypothetical protein